MAEFDGTDYGIIHIGARTVISDDVRILTHDYSIMRAAQATGQLRGKLVRVVQPVHMGSNVFIEMRTLLLPGMMIGDNGIIGAGSVVAGTIPRIRLRRQSNQGDPEY